MSVHDAANGPPNCDGDRAARIKGLLFEHIQARIGGEQVSDEKLVAAHPNLMPELRQQLELLAQMDQRPPEDRIARTATNSPSQDRFGVLKIRCPHCHQNMEISAETCFEDITCSSCAGRFRLVDYVGQTSEVESPKRLGRFELLETVGSGSFGIVWKARDTELDRTVAIKVPHQHWLSPSEIQQFLHEARTAAQLNHPNIVSVHEVGREENTAYIVCDFVDGMPLSDRLQQEHPSFHEAAQLCQDIATALHHAHQAGVIHRDLKPQNIMLTQDGQPMLTDFGLARREAAEITMSVDGRVLGTPAYMSPEQARGEADRADHRSDIYSLGVILFQLLTGELPFRGSVRMMIHQVVNEEPSSPQRLNSRVPGDLATICLKCLEKEPRQRFSSAHQLSQELGRYLRGEPVQTRPISRVSRAGRWCRRNPLLTTATSLALLLAAALAIGGPIAAWYQSRLAEQNRHQLYISDMAAAMDASRLGEWQRLETRLRRYIPSAGQNDLRQFEWYLLWRRWRLAKDVVSFDMPAAVQTVSPRRMDGVVVGHNKGLSIVDLSTKHQREVFSIGNERQLMAAVSPRNPNIAISASLDGVLRWHDIQRNEENELENRQGEGELWRFAFSADGKKLCTTFWINSAGENWMDVWDLENQVKSLPKIKKDGHGFWDVCFSPDGEVIASAGWDSGSVRLWDAATGHELDELPAFGPVGVVRFSPRGDFLVAGCGDRFLRLWRTSDYRLVHEQEAHDSRITSIAFAPDGQRLASGARDSAVKLWRIFPTGRIQLVDAFSGHEAEVNAVCFLRDGRIASGGTDGRVLIWNATKNPNRHVLRGHTNLVRAVDISPDGRYVASGGHDYQLRIWDLQEDVSHVRTGHNGTIRAVAFSPDGKLVATGGWDSQVILWDAQRLIPLRQLLHELPVWDVWFSTKGKLVIGLGRGIGAGRNEDRQRIQAWRVDTGEPFPIDAVPSQELANPAFTSPEGNFQLVLQGKTVSVKDIRQNKRLWQTDQGRRFSTFCFLPENRKTVACADGNTIRLLDLHTGEERARLTGHEHQIWDLSVSQDGRIIVSASEDHTVRVWRAATRDEVDRAAW